MTSLTANRRLYLISYSVVIIASCTALSLSVSAQSRVDISPFAVIGMAPGETITLKATADPSGQGCRAQLGFQDGEGNTLARSLAVNLAPRQSASTSYVAKNFLAGRLTVRPVAWVEDRRAPQNNCLLAAFLPTDHLQTREISSTSNCNGAQCQGVFARDLDHRTLRLYVAATDRVCHAQLGFRRSSGRTSETARYATVKPGHVVSLDWWPDDDELASAHSLIPVVAFHPGDRCISSAELFASENEPAASPVLVESYESPVVGLAVDPESVEATIQILKAQLEAHPEDLWIINSLAIAYDKHGERMRAVRILSDQVEVNPQASESWYLLAKLQFQEGQYNSAATSLEKTLALDPGNITAKAAYADVLTKVQRMDEARKLFETLLSEPQSRSSGVLTGYADFLYLEGKFPEALTAVEESDARHPNCSRTLLVEAKVLEGLKRIPDATQSAERAVQIDPSLRAARFLLLRLYHAQGNEAGAARQAAWITQNPESTYR